MRNAFLIVTIVGALFGARTASAQETGIGLGVETLVTGAPSAAGTLGAPSFVYDGGAFHVDALLYFSNIENGDTTFGLGGRFFFVLHEGDRADLSLGGGLSVVHTDHEPRVQPDESDLHLEVAGKIRAFLCRNVALHAVLGLGAVLADESADSVGFAGNLLGSAGLTYFFY